MDLIWSRVLIIAHFYHSDVSHMQLVSRLPPNSIPRSLAVVELSRQGLQYSIREDLKQSKELDKLVQNSHICLMFAEKTTDTYIRDHLL
jgi:hypothetical protein